MEDSKAKRRVAGRGSESNIRIFLGLALVRVVCSSAVERERVGLDLGECRLRLGLQVAAPCSSTLMRWLGTRESRPSDDSSKQLLGHISHQKIRELKIMSGHD